jgi:hypothetical protein
VGAVSAVWPLRRSSPHVKRCVHRFSFAETEPEAKVFRTLLKWHANRFGRPAERRCVAPYASPARLVVFGLSFSARH